MAAPLAEHMTTVSAVPLRPREILSRSSVEVKGFCQEFTLDSIAVRFLYLAFGP
jgi:hypothetical protein